MVMGVYLAALAAQLPALMVAVALRALALRLLQVQVVTVLTPLTVMVAAAVVQAAQRLALVEVAGRRMDMQRGVAVAAGRLMAQTQAQAVLALQGLCAFIAGKEKKWFTQKLNKIVLSTSLSPTRILQRNRAGLNFLITLTAKQSALAGVMTALILLNPWRLMRPLMLRRRKSNCFWNCKH
jgi:hypothetical protein